MHDSEIDLANAALQLARLRYPDADWLAAQAHLSEIARDAAEMARALANGDLLDRAQALSGLVAGQHGYLGDTEHYDDVDNANLIRVIDRRRGLPVALGILWLHAARAAGWAARGIDFPGHFLVALEGVDARGKALVTMDVFAGGAKLDRDDLRRLFKHFQGERAEIGPGQLAAMSNRSMLLRLQNNIKSRLLQAGQFTEAAACLDEMLRVAPDEVRLWHEAGMLHHRLDHFAAAMRCYERMIALSPASNAASLARGAIDELRGRLN